MKTRNFKGEVVVRGWYRPGTYLTKQTGSIPDTVRSEPSGV
jgi:hypothetical protein